MRSFSLMALAALLLAGTLIFIDSVQASESVQMLPPLTYDSATCGVVGGATATKAGGPLNWQKLLMWDGSTAIRCSSNVLVYDYTAEGNGSLLVKNHLLIYGTTKPIGGLVLPGTPTNGMVAGQIWLVQ